MTKQEAIDFLDEIQGWFPQCSTEIKEIKIFVRRSKYKGKGD